MKITVGLDEKGYVSKPKTEISKINWRVVRNQKKIELFELAKLVGERGYTFCPAVFCQQKRSVDNFVQMQLFALDFDSGITFEEIEERSERYHIPIAFAYHTFSSEKDYPKFRVVFLNDVVVDDRCAAEIMLGLLLRIFNEADKCCKDVSRIFFGGKGLIGEIKMQSINIVSLTVSFQQYLFEKSPKNYSKEINKFAKHYDICSINSCLQIFNKDLYNKVEGFLDTDPYIYGSITKFPSKSPLYTIHTHYQNDVRKIQASDQALRISPGVLTERCQLYRDFIVETYIEHNERFLIMTNMLHLYGGRKDFLKIIKERGYDLQEWNFNTKYAKDRGYKPQSCNGTCPYSEVCNHKVNIVNTVKCADKIKTLRKEQVYYTVNEVYRHICSCLEKAISSPRNGFYMIPAQTAVGKTKAYCDIICREKKQRFLIAVPTNRLKREIEERLLRAGADILVTLSIEEMEIPADLKRDVAYYYQLGLGQKIVILLRDFIKCNEKSSDPKMQLAIHQCREYLALNSNINKKQHLVTTHARLSTLPEEVIKNFIIIVDEDILATFFKNIRTVSVQAVETAVEFDDCPILLQQKFNQLVKMPEDSFIRLEPSACFDNISENILSDLEIWENVNNIALASVCYKSDNYIHYFCPNVLPKGKYIILSATAEVFLEISV